MNYHALRSAVALYRGGTLSLEQAARQAGVSSTRMEAALRRHGVPLRSEVTGPAVGDRIDTLEASATHSMNAD